MQATNVKQASKEIIICVERLGELLEYVEMESNNPFLFSYEEINALCKIEEKAVAEIKKDSEHMTMDDWRIIQLVKEENKGKEHEV